MLLIIIEVSNIRIQISQASCGSLANYGSSSTNQTSEKKMEQIKRT